MHREAGERHRKRILELNELQFVLGLKGIENGGGNSAVDWVQAEWPLVYSGFVDRSVRLNLPDREVRVPQIVEFDNSVGRIPMASIEVRAIDDPFRLDPEIEHLTQAVIDEIRLAHLGITNGTSVRLAGCSSEADHGELRVQPVGHFDYLRTNLQMDRPLEGDVTLRQLAHPQGVLEPLEASKTANPLGVDILLFTAEGEMIVQKRSTRMAVRPGALAPSASGGFDWTDVAGAATLADVPVWREATEELGISGEQIRDMRVLGITRELARGGQPEAFFAGIVDARRDEIEASWQAAKDRWENSEIRFYDLGSESVAGLSEPEEFRCLEAAVADFNEETLDEASVTLQANVALWLAWKRTEALGEEDRVG